MGIEEVQPTTVNLQLAERSLVHPEGKVEDVPVKVDKFIFPVDSIMFDYEANREVFIILGRPFRGTTRIIKMQNRELTMRVQDENLTSNFLKQRNI